MFYYLDNFLIFQFCGSLQSMFVLWWCLHLRAAWKCSEIAAVLRPATTKASSPVRVSNIFSGKWQHNYTSLKYVTHFDQSLQFQIQSLMKYSVSNLKRIIYLNEFWINLFLHNLPSLFVTCVNPQLKMPHSALIQIIWVKWKFAKLKACLDS